MKNMNKKILVTKPYLPTLKEYNEYLKKIWEHESLTNNGPFTKELEEKLCKFLGVKHCLLVSNGTIAIQIAIKALDLGGEIITTPFTYVATLNSILWEKCQPVFVDIDPHNMGIDPKKLESAITSKTTAILGVHVYGNPSSVHEIKKIADKHNLRVIYDAAHCFGTKLGRKSILKFGDISTLSFHATKLFHTVEGGAVVTNDDRIAKKIDLLRSFGHVGDQHFIPGINGKLSEIHAAMGLANLPKVKSIIKKRSKISDVYNSILNKTGALTVSPPSNVEFNYAYFPVIFDSENTMLQIKDLLERNDINTRRYFYPSLNTLNYVEYKHCPVAEDISSRILCLPMYHRLSLSDARRIARLIEKYLMENPQRIKVSLNVADSMPALRY